VLVPYAGLHDSADIGIDQLLDKEAALPDIGQLEPSDKVFRTFF